MAQALAWGLRADGYIVDLADNGTDGLWKATEDRHDVIILDVMLPRIDGYQLCRGLPDQAPWPDIAQRAVRQATRLEELVEQLLLLAKGDDRRLAPSREPTDLGALLREMVATTAAGGIAVGVDGPASVTVAGDPEHLFRLFRNIVDENDGSPVIHRSKGQGERSTIPTFDKNRRTYIL